MAIEWTKTLETGVDWQDKQHKELVRRINCLLEGIEKGAAIEEFIDMFNFLDDYVVIHFGSEEEFMGRYTYPRTLQHVTEHTNFIEELSSLRDEVKSGITPRLIMRLKSKVIDWLINHICVSDKELGAFLKNIIDEKRKRLSGS